MNLEIKRQLKEKVRHAYGLLNVLRCDVDELRKDANNYDLVKMEESLADTSATLQTLTLLIEEIEYMFKLDKTKRPY